MEVQLKVGFSLLVKLDIEYNDKTSKLTLCEDDLTFSNDGKEVLLRRQTVERLCRSREKIESYVEISVLFFNDQEKLQPFPELMFVSKVNSSEMQISAFPLAQRAQVTEKVIRIVLEKKEVCFRVSPKSSQARKAAPHGEKQVTKPKKTLEDLFGNSSDGSDICLSSQSSDEDFEVQEEQQPTLTDESYFYQPVVNLAMPLSQPKQRRQSTVEEVKGEEDEDQSEDAGELDDVLNSMGCIDEVDFAESADVDSNAGGLRESGKRTNGVVTHNKRADELSGGDFRSDNDKLSDIVEELNKENMSQSKKTEQSQVETEAAFPAQKAVTKVKVNVLQALPEIRDRRPSTMKMRRQNSKADQDTPALSRNQSQLASQRPASSSSQFLPMQPALMRSHSHASNSSIGSKSPFMRRSNFNPSQMTLEQRVQELETNQMFMRSIIEQLCSHIGFDPNVFEDEVYKKQAASLRTVEEDEENSSASSLMPPSHAQPALIRAQSESMQDLVRPKKLSLSQKRHSMADTGHSNFRRSFGSNRTSSILQLNSQPSSFMINTLGANQGTSNSMYPDNISATGMSQRMLNRCASNLTSSNLTARLTQKAERPDIVFAYANVFGLKNAKDQFIPLSDRQIIQPDIMFKNIIKAVKQENKKLTIHKRILNFQSFDDILSQDPRVLIIMCHGMLKTDKVGNERCFFCFENADYPYLIDEYDKDRLLTNLKGKKVNIDVIVLSTCHSAKLGKILVENISPAPAVIAINTTDQIAQQSTFTFNHKFLISLIRQKTVKEAFQEAKDLVAAMPKEDNRCCCCNHGHTPQCLYVDYVNKSLGDNWEKACKILHQDSCDCFSKIVKAHADDIGEDRIDEAQLCISHEQGCHNYKRFFEKLTHSSKAWQRQLEHSKLKGFLQEPVNKYGKGNYNIKCCCQSHIAHRESDKFMIVNGEPHEAKLNKHAVFDQMEDGEPEVFQKSFANVRGLNDDIIKYFPRKEEIQEILRLFLDSMPKIIVAGPTGIKIVRTIAKAIRYAVEHDFEACKDGAYYIDLNDTHTIQEVYQSFIVELKLNIQKADQNEILSDTYLSQKRSTVVFQHTEKMDSTLRTQFWRFVRHLEAKTELRLVFVMQEEEADEIEKEDDTVPIVRMTYMDKMQAIDFLKRILQIENKIEFVRNIDLATHKVIEMWEKMNFLDNEAFRIVRNLNKQSELIDIANEMELKLSMTAREDNLQQQVSNDATLYGFSVLSQMVRSGETLLNDFIIFLTVCPQGLELTEIEILLRKLPSQLSPSDRDQKIKLYLSILRDAANVGEDEEQNLNQLMEDENDKEELENLKEIVQNLLFFEVVEDEVNRIQVKLSDNEREAIEFMVKNNSQIRDKFASIGSSDILKLALDFFVAYAKHLLFRTRDMRSTVNSDHRFVSGSLLMGMWQKIQATSADIEDFQQLSRYETHMTQNRQNFYNLLKREQIEKLIPNLFCFKSNESNEMLTEDQRVTHEAIIYKLRELSFILPLIMCRLDQNAQAIVFITAARKLFEIEQQTWYHGVLNLLHATNIVHLAKSDGDFNNMDYFHELKQEAFQIFYKIGDTEGQANAYLIWAIMLLFSGQRNGQIDGSFDINNSAGLDEEEFNMDQIFSDGRPNALDCFEHAMSLFKLAESQNEDNDCSFNIAKCLYEKTNILMGSYDDRGPLDQSDEPPMSRKLFFQSKKEEILELMREAKARVKKVEKENCKLPKPVQRNHNYVRKFFARCNMMKAKLYMYIEEDSEALNFIQGALEHLQELNRPLAKRGSVYQNRKSRRMSKEDPIEQRLRAEEQDEQKEPEAHDNSLIQSLITMKNLVLQKLRQNANNLFTFAKATPLVNYSQHNATPVSDAMRSDFDMRWRILSKLADTGKEYKVKFDILTLKLLKEIAKNGSRLLHITSDISNSNQLCIEGHYGICNRQSLKKLEYTFRQISPYGLQVDVIGIALPNSMEVGKMFRNLRVKHVLCFDQVCDDTTPGQFESVEKDDLVRFQFNYIYNFCVQFYTGLVNEKTVIQSFRDAEEYMNDTLNMFTDVFQCKDLPLTQEDLNIKAVLLDAEKKVHDQKLFDSTAVDNTALVLRNGSVIDTSRMRGQLIGMQKNKFSYVGRKPELFYAIKALSNRRQPCPLVHVRGQEHVGKTRFIQEVCYYFYCHNEFRYIILFKDLSKLESYQDFKDFMDMLNKQIESRKGSDSKTNPSSIENESQQEDDEYSQGSHLGPQRDILWAFTNADKLKKDYWNRLESRMLDIYQSHPSIRFMLTSSAESRKFNFTCFFKQEEIEEIQAAEQEEFQDAHMADHRINDKPYKNRFERRMDIKLHGLKEREAVDLVLYHTRREIDKSDFNSDHDLQFGIKKQMELEKVIQDCKGLPYLLLLVADLLSKGNLLYKIIVEKQGGDRLKGTAAHSKAKRKEFTVKVQKDRDAHSSLMRCRTGGNYSSCHLLETIDENASGQKNKEKGKSKEKKQKLGKNSKRKDREKALFPNEDSATYLDKEYSDKESGADDQSPQLAESELLTDEPAITFEQTHCKQAQALELQLTDLRLSDSSNKRLAKQRSEVYPNHRLQTAESVLLMKNTESEYARNFLPKPVDMPLSDKVVINVQVNQEPSTGRSMLTFEQEKELDDELLGNDREESKQQQLPAQADSEGHFLGLSGSEEDPDDSDDQEMPRSVSDDLPRLTNSLDQLTLQQSALSVCLESNPQNVPGKRLANKDSSKSRSKKGRKSKKQRHVDQFQKNKKQKYLQKVKPILEKDESSNSDEEAKSSRKPQNKLTAAGQSGSQAASGRKRGGGKAGKHQKKSKEDWSDVDKKDEENQKKQLQKETQEGESDE